MQITATVIEVTETHLRLRTISKKQEVDVFFTPAKKLAVETLFEPHMVTILSIEIQTADVDGSKLAKLWLLWVQSPPLPDCSEFNPRQIDRYKMILPLYDTK